jgi:hypothetical protein
MTMKYLLLIHGNEQEWDDLGEAEQGRIMENYRQFSEDIVASGHFVSGSQLAPVSMATSVRIRDGKRVVTDGPFAETREQLGGYYVIEAKDLDEAIGIAARIPSAHMGTVEVRPQI